MLLMRVSNVSFHSPFFHLHISYNLLWFLWTFNLYAVYLIISIISTQALISHSHIILHFLSDVFALFSQWRKRAKSCMKITNKNVTDSGTSWKFMPLEKLSVSLGNVLVFRRLPVSIVFFFHVLYLWCFKVFNMSCENLFLRM